MPYRNVRCNLCVSGAVRNAKSSRCLRDDYLSTAWPMVPWFPNINLVVSLCIFTGHGVAMIHSDGTFETSGFTSANSMERVASTPTPTDFSIFFRPCHFLVVKVGTVPVAVGHPHLEVLNGLHSWLMVLIVNLSNGLSFCHRHVL